MKKKFLNMSCFPSVVVLTCMIFSHHLVAQFGSIRFNKITSSDGLSHDFVNTIVRDTTGYMWFGTRAGLNRYDGYEFEFFLNEPDNNTSICDNEITSSLCTSNGTLWFGTRNGLALFDSKAKKFKNFHPPGYEGKTVVINCLEEDVNKRLWIGTSKGLFVKGTADETLQRASMLQPLLGQLDSTSIAYVLFDESKIYVATNGYGLWVIDAKSLLPEVWNSSSTGMQKLYSNALKHIVIDQRKQLWLGYNDGTIERRDFSNQSLHVYNELNTYSRGDMQNQLTELVMDNEGRVWAAASLSGLSLFDERTSTFQNLQDKPYITAFDNTRAARSIYVDSEGTLWLAMHTSGVLYCNLSKQSFINYERPDGADETEMDQQLLSNWTRAFEEDPEQHLWIATVDGVSILDRSTQTFSSLRNKTEVDVTIANNSIRSLLNVNDKYMLIGTAGGITRYDFNTGISRNHYADSNNPKAINGNFVLDIQQNFGGEIYIATSNGFSRYDGETDSFYNWTDIPELGSTLGESMRCFALGENGVVWIAKSNGNLLEFKPTENKIEEYKQPQSEYQNVNNNVLDIINDGNILWVGTLGGLLKFDKTSKHFSRVNFEERIAPLMVGNLRRDGDEILWFTGTTGLVKYNITNSTSECFTVHHGLPTNSFHFQRSFVTHDSLYCMASMKGIVMFRPEGLKQLTRFPKAYITELRVLNVAMDLSRMSEQKLSLTHKENFFSITLNAFDYMHRDNIHYAFMLEGLHTDWVYNGKNRQLSFTNVPSGDYVLKYKTTTFDGIWPDEFQTLYIHINTVFYKTWWFGILILLSAVAIVHTAMKYRQQQKQKVETLRQKIASDLHDDIGATLSSIRLYSDVARARKTDNEPLLEKISENARGMVDSMSDIVWAIKPGNDKLGDLKKRMQNFAMEMCGPLDIELHFNFDESLSEQKLHMEMRKDIYLVFKEAVNNAVKYSSCKNLRVSISRIGNVLQMEIADDGRGFETSARPSSKERESRGNGLDNMQMRVAAMKGKLTIESSENNGTKILSEIPFTLIG